VQRITGPGGGEIEAAKDFGIIDKVIDKRPEAPADKA
jgi:hypothetical protein